MGASRGRVQDSASPSPRVLTWRPIGTTSEALNMPASHPARTEFDTMFVDHDGAPPGRPCCARTRRPCRSGRCWRAPPLYLIAPGRVFRRDTPDTTHMPVFHQLEGLVVDRDITSAISPERSRRSPRPTSARASPAACGRATSRSPNLRASSTSAVPTGAGSELGGCGMVHPRVLSAGGIDPDEWSGFAFGFGIDRMARSATPSRTCARCTPATSASRSSSDEALPQLVA